MNKDVIILFQGKRIKILEVGLSKSGKTMICRVENNSGIKLGAVKWHGAWRKYVFCPSIDTIFDTSCLDEISGFLMTATKYHRKDGNQTSI